MARIDHRTAEYNTTANPMHLQGTFATTQTYRDYVHLPNSLTMPRITRYYKDTHTAVERMQQIFIKSREWYRREMQRSPMHTTIVKMLNNPEQAQYLTDWREMVLEYPHTADLDATKVAFTESEAKGVADRQTVTTLGKYIKRHAPNIPDHVLRDMVMLSVAQVVLTHDLQEMIDAVQQGPRSCMQGSFDVHPYSVYDPQYGWHMAVRREGGQIDGRCLCLTYGGEKLFVRSYKRHESGYSQSDEGLNAWLEERGYTHQGDWPQGVRLAKIWHHGNLVLPYIDGGADKCANHTAYLTIDDDGEYEGCQQNGYAEDCTNRCTCDSCGDYYDEDDGVWVGYHEDDQVCNQCANDNYTYAYGRNGRQYQVHNDDVIRASDDEDYHSDYLADNGIVYSEHDGEYHPEGECSLIDCTNEYVHHNELHRTNNYFVCLDVDAEVYGNVGDCWQCAASGDWYSSNLNSEYYAVAVDVGSSLFHADCLPDEEIVLHCHHVRQYMTYIGN